MHDIPHVGFISKVCKELLLQLHMQMSNPLKTLGKDLKRHFTHTKFTDGKKHMEKCAAPSVIKEM